MTKLSIKNVLVACDLDEASQGVLDVAIAEATACRAELHLLHVLSETNRKLDSEDRIRHAKKRLESVLPAEQVLDLTCHWEVRAGAIAEQVAQYAGEKDIDLIVLGSRRQSGWDRLLGHRLSDDLLQGLDCPVVVVPLQLDKSSAHSKKADGQRARPHFEAIAPASPAVDLIQRGLSLRATDIHLDPTENDRYVVRLRIDGRMEQYCELDGDLAKHLLQQLKVLAELDIAEPFHAHEGRLQLPNSNLRCQVRITTAPVEGGESVCLRLQSKETMFLPIGELGLTAATQGAVAEMLHRGEGIVLVTGPTGVGKTTTVYAMLRELGPKKAHRNIVTIEDPVEFSVPFLRQMSVNNARGNTLNAGLRTMLRMDPDVVFVGEIRGTETAEMAMRAASSGKYVFSTLHTRDVASTVTALRDLGVSPRSLAGNLTGIISQRLVRRLCTECRQLDSVSSYDQRLLNDYSTSVPPQLYTPKGCDHCRGSGYRGRVGVFEVVAATDSIVEAIDRGAPEDELRDLIRSDGTPSLTADGLTKAIDGITSVDEIRQIHWMP